MAKKLSLKEQFAKKAQGTAEVIEAEVVEEKEKVSTKQLAKSAKKRTEITKPTRPSGELSVFETAKSINEGFEFGNVAVGNRIKLDGSEFVITVSGSDDEPMTVDEFECVLLGSRIAHSWYDSNDGKLHVAYDGYDTCKDGTPVAELRHLKKSFRVELTLALEGFDEEFTFLTSGTAFYNLRDYAAFLADATKEKGGENTQYAVADIITKVFVKKYKDPKGTYHAPQFEFVRALEED